MMGRLGIFGGTFDPPHLGHLILAEEARYQLALDSVLWVLTPHPPHKQEQSITPLSDRLELLLAAIYRNPSYKLSRVELDRQPPHYALDTIRLLGIRNPGAELIYLMGGDSLRDLPKWHSPLEFVAACHSLGIMRRPGDQIDLERLESQIPGINHKLHFVDTPLLDIASSQIRQRIRTGKPFRYFLPEAVYQLIQKNQLYQTE
jgi:nicotinate-nucleotide adenylyltransferase